MIKLKRPLLLLSLYLFTLPAHSAGFDCTKASSTVEKTYARINNSPI